MKRILIMESGSYGAQIGGAVQATYLLYSYLKRHTAYKIDLIGDFSAVAPHTDTISMEEARMAHYDVIVMNSIRDVTFVNEYLKTHKGAKTIYTDRGNVVVKYSGSMIKRGLSKMAGAVFKNPYGVEGITNKLAGGIGSGVIRRIRHFGSKTYELHLFEMLGTRLDCYVAITVEQEIYARALFKRTKVVLAPAAPASIFRPIRMKHGFDGGIYVGRLEERQKRVSFLIKAVAKLVAEHPDLNGRKLLKIVGDGPDAVRYKELASAMHVNRNVVFTGPVVGEALVREYNNSSFSVSASKWESPGRAFLEALSCGLPLLICSSCNAIIDAEKGSRLVDESNGFEYLPNDIEGYNGKFYRLYTDRIGRAKLGKGAIARSKMFSIERILPRYKKAIDSL